MRKLVLCLVVVMVMVMGFTSVSLAGLMGFFDEQGKPQGTLCCVKAVCLMAKSEAECTKAGGKAIKDCKECAGAKEQPKKEGGAK